MQTPQDLEAMRRLSAAGWGRRRIAEDLGCSPKTVRKHLRQGSLQPDGKPCCNSVLEGQRERTSAGWLSVACPRVVQREAAARLGLSERSLHRWLKAGLLKAGEHYRHPFPNPDSPLPYRLAHCE